VEISADSDLERASLGWFPSESELDDLALGGGATGGPLSESELEDWAFGGGARGGLSPESEVYESEGFAVDGRLGSRDELEEECASTVGAADGGVSSESEPEDPGWVSERWEPELESDSLDIDRE
jgi:hypothetical protein